MSQLSGKQWLVCTDPPRLPDEPPPPLNEKYTRTLMTLEYYHVYPPRHANYRT